MVLVRDHLNIFLCCLVHVWFLTCEMKSVIIEHSTVHVYKKSQYISFLAAYRLCGCVCLHINVFTKIGNICAYDFVLCVSICMCTLAFVLLTPLHLLLRCHLGALNTRKLLLHDTFIRQLLNLALATAEQTQLDCGRLNTENL